MPHFASSGTQANKSKGGSSTETSLNNMLNDLQNNHQQLLEDMKKMIPNNVSKTTANSENWEQQEQTPTMKQSHHIHPLRYTNYFINGDKIYGQIQNYQREKQKQNKPNKYIPQQMATIPEKGHRALPTRLICPVTRESTVSQNKTKEKHASLLAECERDQHRSTH